MRPGSGPAEADVVSDLPRGRRGRPESQLCRVRGFSGAEEGGFPGALFSGSGDFPTEVISGDWIFQGSFDDDGRIDLIDECAEPVVDGEIHGM